MKTIQSGVILLLTGIDCINCAINIIVKLLKYPNMDSAEINKKIASLLLTLEDHNMSLAEQLALSQKIDLKNSIFGKALKEWLLFITLSETDHVIAGHTSSKIEEIYKMSVRDMMKKLINVNVEINLKLRHKFYHLSDIVGPLLNNLSIHVSDYAQLNWFNCFSSLNAENTNILFKRIDISDLKDNVKLSVINYTKAIKIHSSVIEFESNVYELIQAHRNKNLEKVELGDLWSFEDYTKKLQESNNLQKLKKSGLEISFQELPF